MHINSGLLLLAHTPSDINKPLHHLVLGCFGAKASLDDCPTALTLLDFLSLSWQLDRRALAFLTGSRQGSWSCLDSAHKPPAAASKCSGICTCPWLNAGTCNTSGHTKQPCSQPCSVKHSVQVLHATHLMPITTAIVLQSSLWQCHIPGPCDLSLLWAVHSKAAYTLMQWTLALCLGLVAGAKACSAIPLWPDLEARQPFCPSRGLSPARCAGGLLSR